MEPFSIREDEMLVITRKNNERIQIGNDVEVVVLSVQGGRVKLGIVASAETNIRRAELLNRPVRLGVGAR
jgi:carbon storage regulator CsrA